MVPAHGSGVSPCVWLSPWASQPHPHPGPMSSSIPAPHPSHNHIHPSPTVPIPTAIPAPCPCPCHAPIHVHPVPTSIPYPHPPHPIPISIPTSILSPYPPPVHIHPNPIPISIPDMSRWICPHIHPVPNPIPSPYPSPYASCPHIHPIPNPTPSPFPCPPRSQIPATPQQLGEVLEGLSPPLYFSHFLFFLPLFGFGLQSVWLRPHSPASGPPPAWSGAAPGGGILPCIPPPQDKNTQEPKSPPKISQKGPGSNYFGN